MQNLEFSNMDYFSLNLSPTLTLDSTSFLFSLKKKESEVIFLCLKSFWTEIFVWNNKYSQSRFPRNKEHLGKSQEILWGMFAVHVRQLTDHPFYLEIERKRGDYQSAS